jgi:hypothetical protein
MTKVYYLWVKSKLCRESYAGINLGSTDFAISIKLNFTINRLDLGRTVETSSHVSAGPQTHAKRNRYK